MATEYQKYFSQGGTSNQTLPRSFGLNGFSQSTTPEWKSGRADKLTLVYVKCSISIDRNRTVNLNYTLNSGGVSLSTGTFSKTMNAGSVYSGSAAMQIGDLTPAQVTAFVEGLPSATLTLNASFSSGAELNLYKKGGVPFTVTVNFIDLEGSTFSLDKTEYTSGDRPILTIEPMETEGTLSHSVYWSISGHTTEETPVVGTTIELAAIPDSFASYLDGKISDTLTLHGITYEDGVKLGERTIDVIFTAKDMIPTVTISAAPSDGGSEYWERFDSCILTINCNSAHSTHQSLEVAGDFTYSGDVVSSLTVPIFQTGGTKKFTATYTNGRGQVATASVSIEVKKLKPPTVELFEAQRFEESEDDDGNTIFKWSLTSQKVRVAYKYSVDDAGGNVTPSDISLAIRFNGRTILGTSAGMSGQVEYDNRSATSADKSILSGSTFDSNSEHVLTFTVSDGKNNSSATVTIPKARVNLHLAGSDYGVGVGCFVTDSTPEKPVFRCAYPAEFLDGIKGFDAELHVESPSDELVWLNVANNNNQSLTARTFTTTDAGVWLVTFDFIFQTTSATGRRRVEIRRRSSNGSELFFWNSVVQAVSGDWIYHPVTFFSEFDAGDYIDITVYQNSGGTCNVTAKQSYLRLGAVKA